MAFDLTVKQAAALRLMSDPAVSDVMLFGGSRSGKTFLSCYALAVRALKYKKSRHCILRFRFSHVKQSVWYDTFPKMIDLCFPNLVQYIKLNRQDFFVTFPNGSEIWFGGLDDKERVEKILGNEYMTMFFNECSQISGASKDMALTRLAQNAGGRLLALYDCNPASRKHWTYRDFVENPKPAHKAMLINPIDNPNLPVGYMERLKSLPARQRMRFLDGAFQIDVDGALWLINWIDRARGGQCPADCRIVIAVDPAASTGTHGIVAAASDANAERFYVLRDASLQGSPDQWARRAVDLYDELVADCVVIETNQGGDMAVSTLRNVRKDLPIRRVHASKGKITRAEPIAALYEQGRVSHCDYFPDLEEQMCEYTGQPSETSPDRMDALVWALSELTKSAKQSIILPPPASQSDKIGHYV